MAKSGGGPYACLCHLPSSEGEGGACVGGPYQTPLPCMSFALVSLRVRLACTLPVRRERFRLRQWTHRRRAAAGVEEEGGAVPGVDQGRKLRVRCETPCRTACERLSHFWVSTWFHCFAYAEPVATSYGDA